MSASKRELSSQHLRHVREELKHMYLMLSEDGLLPTGGEIKALYAQVEALLIVVDGSKKKNPIT